MEALFFKQLLAFLRGREIHAFYSLPLKASFPAVVLDHQETRIMWDASVVDFTLTLLFNTADQSHMIDFGKIIQDHLSVYARMHKIAIQMIKQAQKPHESGKLRSCILACSARIPHTQEVPHHEQ